jgi:hypothetical protein
LQRWSGKKPRFPTITPRVVFIKTYSFTINLMLLTLTFASVGTLTTIAVFKMEDQ